MLTAREWLLLPAEEQEKRKYELSAHECFLLRTNLEMIRFTEEEKAAMTEEEKYAFTHPRQLSEEEKAEFNKMAQEIFDEMKKKNSARKRK